MKTLRTFSIVLAVCLSAAWSRAQSNAAVSGAQSNAMAVQPLALQAQPRPSEARVRAIVTDGQTGEIISNSTLTFTTIDVPGAEYTDVFGINSAGDMVGIYGETYLSPTRAFLLSGGRFTYLDYPGAYATLAFDINDSGLIVGYAEFQNDSVWLGFEYDGTTFTPIRDGKNSATVCFGLNNAGWVVGGTGTVDATKGFELRGRTFKPIVPLGNYVYIYATGINKAGGAVGWTDYDGFYYRNGKYETIDFPGTGHGVGQTEAWGINDSGLIVGWYNPMSAYNYGFVLAKGNYISFSYPGAILTYAFRINTSGEIVGDYTLDYNTYHGFVTSPLSPADFPPSQ
jgi:hypothetical protein